MSTTHTLLMALVEQIERLKDEVTGLKRVVEDTALMSEVEKQEWRERKVFDQAETLTLTYLQQLGRGMVLKLISCSYHYPTTFPVFNRFEYKHDHIDEQNPTEFGYEVHGFSRRHPFEQWEPYRFLAGETEATTFSCSGTIKRITVTG